MNNNGTIIVDALVALIITLIISTSLVQICNNINQFNQKINEQMEIVIKERNEQIRSYYH